jgi:hypothetical protein
MPVVLDRLRRDADLHEGRDWTVGVDAAVVRAHQHAAGARHELPADIPRRSSRPWSWTQRAGRNDKKSAARPSRESLGRSRGGLTSKIHLAADTRCRPISRVTTAGHRHDSLAFAPVMAGIRIGRRGRGRPRTRPARVLGDRRTPAVRSAPTCADVASPRPSRNRPISRPTGCAAAAEAVDHRRSTPRATSGATSSNERSTSSKATGQSPPATTRGTSCSAEPSTSPQSESGSATPSRDPRDRL